MIKYLLTISLGALMLSSGNAAVTINLSGNPTTGPQFSVSGGGLIPDGSTVRVGTFAAAPTANSTFAELAALFQEFGTIAAGSGTDNVTGANTGRIQRSNIAGSSDAATSPQPDSYFADKAVYIWVYSGEKSDTAPQGVFGSATLFRDQATAVSVSMGSFASAYGNFGDGSAPASVTAGATQGTVSAYTLAAPVPEPTASVFAVFTMMGLLARRRR